MKWLGTVECWYPTYHLDLRTPPPPRPLGGDLFLSYILLVLKADLHLMLGKYIQLRHPIIHNIGDFLSKN
jgi:hypothetical protein